MNLDKLIGLSASIVIGAAALGRLDDLQRWIWIAQAKVAYESRASAWGSPRFFHNENINKNERRLPAKVSKNPIEHRSKNN